jgi:hypothetical protein
MPSTLISLPPGHHPFIFLKNANEYQPLDKNRKFCERGYIPPIVEVHLQMEIHTWH